MTEEQGSAIPLAAMRLVMERAERREQEVLGVTPEPALPLPTTDDEKLS